MDREPGGLQSMLLHRVVLGASMRNYAHGKGHEEGGFGIRKGMRDRASGNPLFPSIYPQNQSLPTLLFHALTYTSDFMGVCSPPVLSEKE